MEPNEKPPESNETKGVVVEIDGEEKTFSVEDVKNLVAQQASATQKTQEVAGILEAVNRYGVTTQEYLENSEGSFALMNDLIQKGIIDEQGNVLKAKVPDAKPPEVPSQGTPPPKQTPPDRKDDIALKALVDPITKELERLRGDNILMMKLRMQDKVQAKYSNLTEEDISRLFSIAEGDQTKTFMQHGEEMSKSKVEQNAELEKEWAKKHGLNLEEMNEKQVFQQDPAAGASVMSKGMKISFKRGKDSVTPREATAAFLDKLD